jgi:GDPmannose 4,6-dehydratase
MKRALITGIAGQDGAYLTEFLLKKNYIVLGGMHSRDKSTLWRLTRLNVASHPNLKLISHDVTDVTSTIRVINEFQPDEIYNLAAQSFVSESFTQPIKTANSTGIGALNVLEAIRSTSSNARYYQASSSEMFGKIEESPQTENTKFYPRSPYGISKLFAHWTTVNYRESYGMFAASGILFNHESPLRGPEFVTRKITRALCKFYHGSEEVLLLGNLNAQRDWGFARDYVEGMWMILQAENPETFILATGKAISVRQFLKLAGSVLDIELEFEGMGIDEVAFEKSTGKLVAKVSSELFRPAEVDLLIGDFSKAKNNLGWSPSTSIEALVEHMVIEEKRKE